LVPSLDAGNQRTATAGERRREFKESCERQPA
jgi:hypothetical protein